MLAMIWKRADGTSPGLSRTTLRNLRLLLLLPILHRVVVGLTYGVLLEAVPLVSSGARRSARTPS